MDAFWQNIVVLVLVGSATLFLINRFRPGRKKKSACSACRVIATSAKPPTKQ